MTTINPKTVRSTGEKRVEHSTGNNYWASLDFLKDVFEPLLQIESLQGKYVAEIGSETGRIVNMLLDAGAARVVAIEPGKNFPTLLRNVRPRSNRVSAVHAEAEVIREYVDLDIVCAFGVLHHVANPERIISASLCALRPGGKLIISVYGREGNKLPLFLASPVRQMASKLPQGSLPLVAAVLVPGVIIYKTACRLLPLPMKWYMVDHIDLLTVSQLHGKIQDQLKPPFAQPYAKDEAIALLANNGFVNVQCHHRHKHSWTVVGERPQNRVSD